MDLSPVTQLTRQTDCQHCPSGESGPCGAFPASVRSKISAASMHRRFASGATILPGGQTPARVGIILSGLVKFTSLDDQGNEHLLHLLHPGELVGDPFGGPLPFSCEAATDVTLCMAPSAVILDAFESNPTACAAHLRHMMRQQFEQHCFKLAMRGRSSLQRLAYWIAAQAPSGNADRVLSLRIILSRRDLASLLDCTAETISRNLHRMHDLRLIRIVTPERVEIRNQAGLEGLAGQADSLCKSLLQRRAREWGARAINLPRFSPRAAPAIAAAPR